MIPINIHVLDISAFRYEMDKYVHLGKSILPRDSLLCIGLLGHMRQNKDLCNGSHNMLFHFRIHHHVGIHLEILDKYINENIIMHQRIIMNKILKNIRIVTILITSGTFS